MYNTNLKCYGKFMIQTSDTCSNEKRVAKEFLNSYIQRNIRKILFIIECNSTFFLQIFHLIV